MKTCIVCKEFKDFTNFHKNLTHRDGYQSKCNDCQKAYNRVYLKTYNKTYSKTDKSRFHRAKYFSKKKLCEWKLTFIEFQEIISKPCYYCNNELGDPVKFSGGIDRLDSSVKEYSVSNSVSCCWFCNTKKNVKSAKVALEEIKALKLAAFL